MEVGWTRAHEASAVPFISNRSPASSLFLFSYFGEMRSNGRPSAKFVATTAKFCIGGLA